MKEYTNELLLFAKTILSILIQSLLITAFKGNDMKKTKKYLMITTALLTILNIYGFYLNLEYYIGHSSDPTELKMVLFNFLEVIFLVYLLFAFSFKLLTYTEKTCIIILSMFIAITNAYYLVLDMIWSYNLLSVLFWVATNALMVVASVGFIIYIGRLKNNNKIST